MKTKSGPVTLSDFLRDHLKLNAISDQNCGPDTWTKTWIVTEFIRSGSFPILQWRDSVEVENASVINLLKEIGDKIGVPFHLASGDGRVTGALYLSSKQPVSFYVEAALSKRGSTLTGVYLEAFTTDSKLQSSLNEVLLKYKKKNDGAKISVVVNNNGLDIVTLGYVNEPLVRENYEDSTLKQYDYVVSQYKHKDPTGRMTIINGPPGTGKTYMVRALIGEISPANILLIPQSMVGEIDGPGLLPLLMDVKSNDNDDYSRYEWAEVEGEERSKLPIVLILEDADSCLVPRAADNASVVSSLLNYTDGMFGQLLDIRVIATTNAETLEFDQAYMRPGRLCAHMNIGPVSKKKAKEIFARLKTENTFKDNQPEYTLAEIYAQAKGVEATSPFENKKMGFNSK